MSETAIEWRHVSYWVRQGFWFNSKPIIQDFSLSIPKGTITGLIGPNGAGKTTTIKLGAGLIRPDTGQVLINGKCVQVPKNRISIGLLTENQYVYPYLKLKEWLRMLGALSGLTGEALKKKVTKVLGMVDLLDKSNELMHILSKGQLQRAGIAQVFLNDPEIIILDEPMSGLDPFWRYRIHNMLVEYARKGGAVLFSSHIMTDVLRLSQQMVLMESGRIRWTGGVGDLPERNKGFQAVFFTDNMANLGNDISYKTIEQRPDGAHVITIDLLGKKKLIELASSGKIVLESLNPLYSRIEEIFYEDGIKTD